MGSLGERQAAVLRAVVADYIRTGDPVGSATVAARHRMRVSAATIRNDMASLEDLGFLHQPHTSSGRIPTDRGYRFYVDALPGREALPSRWRRSIDGFFGQPPPDPQEVIRGAALLLSRITRYGAVAQPPRSTHVVVMGTANIASEETFERRETVRGLLEILEEERDVLDLLRRLVAGSGVVVRIGAENPISALHEVSVVAAPYGGRGRMLGAIAVLGPTRMHYRQSISTVSSVAEHLGRTIERLAG
jgi:transcriptional regulator of heat shock response